MKFGKNGFKFTAYILSGVLAFSAFPSIAYAADGDGGETVINVIVENDDEESSIDSVSENEMDIEEDNISDADVDICEIDNDFVEDNDTVNEESDYTDEFVSDDLVISDEDAEVYVEEMYENAASGTLVSTGSYNNISWKLYDTDSDNIGDQLVVSGRGKMENISSVRTWKEMSSIITSVVIEEEITSVYGFSGFSNLEIVKLPSTVTDISSSAFRECRNLKNINLPSGVTSIGYGAFYECNSLTSIIIPNKVTAIEESAFNGCENLNHVELPEGIISIGDSAFLSCIKLKDINFPSTLTCIGDSAFKRCDSLVEVIIPEGITKIYPETFYSCGGLEKVTLPNSIETIGANSFAWCSNLKDINIPEGVTSIGVSAFEDCRRLTVDINLPSLTYIGNNAFKSCSNVTAIIFSNSLCQPDPNSGASNFANDTMVYVVKDSAMEEWVKKNRTYGVNYKYVEEYDPQKCVIIDSASLTLDGSIAINFYVKLPDSIINDSSAKVLLGYGPYGPSYSVKKYSVRELTAVSGESNTYKVSIPVSAKNIKDDVGFAVVDGNMMMQALLNSKNERITGNTYSYSVYDYCQAVINSSSDQKQKNIANAILTYGEYAMDYFDYGDVNDSLTPVSNLSSTDLAKYKATYSGTIPANVSYVGSSLLLKSKTRMRYYFTIDNSSGVSSYKISIGGKSVNLTKSANGSNVYYAETGDITMKSLGTTVNVSISDGKTSYTISSSPLSYIYSVSLTGEKDLKNICSALYALYKTI